MSRRYSGLILTSIVILLVSCQRVERPKATDRSGAASAVVVDGGVLVAGLNAEPEGLNPLIALSQPAQNVMGLIFSRLANLDSDLVSLQPALARSWDIASDGRTVRFHLRTDAKWHDGQPLTAADIVFTYHLQIDPTISWDGASYKDDILDVRAEDDSTVIFCFKKPTPTMVMDAVEGYIVPRHVLESVKPAELFTHVFNRQPVGCGPYHLVEWKNQQYLVLAKHADFYLAGKPHLERIVFRFVPDNVSLFQQLRSGEIDLAEGLLPQDFLRLQKAWNAGDIPIRPISYLGRQYDFIGWNLLDGDSYQAIAKLPPAARKDFARYLKPHPLFGKQKVRAALTIAVDRQKITEVVNAGQAIPMHGPIPLIIWAYNPDANHQYDYNPKLARQWLAEEGWRDTDGDGILDKDGNPFTFELVTNTGNIRRQTVMTMLQEQWKSIGVKVTTRSVDPGLLTTRILTGRTFDAVLFGWNVGLKMELTPLFHSQSFFIPFHFTGYYSPVFDVLEDNARATLDPHIAQKEWDKIAALLSEDLPYTWLYYKLECSALHRRFKSVIIDKRGMYNNLEDWWIPLEERIPADQAFN